MDIGMCKILVLGMLPSTWTGAMTQFAMEYGATRSGTIRSAGLVKRIWDR